MALSESSLLLIAESLVMELDSLLTKLDSSASLDFDVSSDLRHLKWAMLSLRGKLSRVDYVYERQHHPVLQKWLRKLKQILSDAQNLLDDIHFECSSLKRRRKQQWLKPHLHHHQGEGTSPTVITKVRRFFSSSPTMATHINDITKRLQHCAADKIDVDIRLQFNIVNQSYVVGREIDKEIIIEKLLMHHHHYDDDQSLSVLPIVGMGGLGTTTLAKIVFDDERIRESFSVQMWVCLSHHFGIEQLIIEMINSSCSSDTPHPRIKEGELKMTQLLGCLEKKLAGKKFLLVLDDVRKEDLLKWDELRYLIPTDMNESKILLTTHSDSIASMAGTIPSHNLEPLSLKDSLSLFERCATIGGGEKYPNLIEVAIEIVNQCGRIPLAIKTMGSVLLSNYEMLQWEFMRGSEFRDLPKVNDILPALSLSYHYMPLHLKQCFELFSLYPNDFVFHSSELVSLWAALDLLPSPKINETLIDISLQCLQELMPRYFLKEFVDFGTSYYFQLHDLVHDLARDIAKYECLMANSNNQDIPENVKHLSFVVNDLIDKSFTPKYDDVKTILFPIEGVGATGEDFLNMCLSRFKYLRILDLSDSTYEVLPWSIGKLRHLRFFSLERNEKIKRIPNSICKLQNLQVLNLVGCVELKNLPKGLRNLISLRQLGITTKESILPENDIANLQSLEILNIESCNKLESFFVGIKLASLKTLEITNCGSLKYLPLDIDHFPQLETLLVHNCEYLELTKRHGDQNSSLQLKAIRLHSLPQLTSLPRWLTKSTNTLQSLLIVNCKNLMMLPEWLSTFFVLGSFGIVNCSKLMSLPNDIHCLSDLGYLRIEDCPELCKKCQPYVGEYWPKISHINKIFISEQEDIKEEEGQLEEV